MSDIVTAHEALQDLFRGEIPTYSHPLGVTIEFHEWAETKGYDVSFYDLREKHVWMDYRMGEPVARLVLEWVEELSNPVD